MAGDIGGIAGYSLGLEAIRTENAKVRI